MPQILVESGPLQGQSFPVQDKMLLGRGQVVDLRLEDGTVSRRHAMLKVVTGGIEISDLGSANGTRINGAPLTSSCVLKDGDQVALGEVLLRFRSGEALTAPAPVAAAAASQVPVLQEMLARLGMFCELGALSGRRGERRNELRRSLASVLAAFPRCQRVALLSFIPGTQRFAPLAHSVREPAGIDPQECCRIADACAAQGEGLFLSDPTALAPWIERLSLRDHPTALACLPVRWQGEILAALYLDSLGEAQALRAADRPILEACSQLLGALLAVHPDLTTRQDTSDEDLSRARLIQQRFLPQDPPNWPGYRFAEHYAAARAVGGDHYDYLVLADGSLAVVVADVSGKGVSGSLYMARLGSYLRRGAETALGPGALLEFANTELCKELEAGMFITVVALCLPAKGGDARYAVAGHTPPMVRPVTGPVIQLEAPSTPPLGAACASSYPDLPIKLAPGDLALMFTDGLDEAHNQRSELLGMERIQKTLAGCANPQQVMDHMKSALSSFVGAEPQSDDLTLVAVQRLP